jgi:phosphopantothenoylcysteine decarboxylase/phosphopantothenate--cysteine ligase
VAQTLALSGKRILVGVCGGIAAYRTCELVRELIKQGAEVQCVLTPHAAEFVAPLTFQALTGRPALIEEFPADDGEAVADPYAHLNVTRGIDCFVIAPATAATLADLAQGRAGNLLTSSYLSCEAPVVLAPAMNVRMWNHAAVKANVATLTARGHRIVQPGTGELACGDVGAGRLAEIGEIAAAVVSVVSGKTGSPAVANLQAKRADSSSPIAEGNNNQVTAPAVTASQALRGRQFIVTGGGTREYLDPVRYITNASTGTLALAVAEALLDAGAEVQLIATELAIPVELGHRLDANTGVRTAYDLQQAIAEALPQADGLVMLAAVADYSPAKYSSSKRKKDGAPWAVELAETPDILKSLAAARKPGQLFIAVSLEDEDWLARAVKKAEAKHVQLMLAVELGADLPFGDRKLQCALFAGSAQVLPPGRRDKREIAAAIAAWLEGHYAKVPVQRRSN